MNDLVIEKLHMIKKEMANLKSEKDLLEAQILEQAEKDLFNSKTKTVRYESSSGNVVTATMAKTVKTIYPSMVNDALGQITDDFVRVTEKKELSDVAKRILGGICLEEYITDDLDTVIASITPDIAVQNTLKKKLRGVNPVTDAKNIKNAIGCSDEDADLYAFLVTEAVVWKEFMRICKVNGIETDEAIKEQLETIRTVFICEETPKIAVID